MTHNRLAADDDRRTGDRNRFLGFGAGLRSRHFRHVIDTRPAVDWFEIISENFMDSQGWPAEALREISRHYPIVPHGVSLSIGSTEPLNLDYLSKLRRLADACDAPWVSDHLCWTSIGGHNSHDLLPLPYTAETLSHVVDRAKTVQDVLGRRLLLENPSSYLDFRHSTMTEWDFMAELVERADCGLLLDVNNIYVCSRNHGWDPSLYLGALPPSRIGQIHIAGHTDHGTHCIDTHIGPIPEPVWGLYLDAIERFGPVSTLLEWDEEIPEFPVLQAELQRAREVMERRVLPHSMPASAVANKHDGGHDAVSNPVDFIVGYEVARP